MKTTVAYAVVGKGKQERLKVICSKLPIYWFKTVAEKVANDMNAKVVKVVVHKVE